MGKRQKVDSPNISAVANKDIIQRLNFLYQASVYLQSLEGRNLPAKQKDASDFDPPPTQNAVQKNVKKKHTANRRRTNDLARDYINCMRQVAQKTTVKIDPSLKRSICFCCNSVLVPGVSVSVRVKDSARHGSHLRYTCLNCRATRRIPSIAEDPGTPIAHQASVHETSVDADAGKESDRPKRAKKTVGRQLPLFARPDAGHVIFRGNDALTLDEAGCVPFV